MEWTIKEIKEQRMARNLGYKAMGKMLGLNEPKYRRIELGLDTPNDHLKGKMTGLWNKWMEPPKVEYGLSDSHSDKQKEILEELGLNGLIRE